MNIHHLKYFHDAVRLGSISAAAKVNFVGQPAVSKAILRLEDELGVTLIVHERKRFQVTDEGQKAFESANRVFNAVECFRGGLNEVTEPAGEVRFACQSSMAESLFLSQGIRHIIKKYPRLEPKLVLGRTDLVSQWLENGSVDFAIAINNRNFSQFEQKKLLDGNFYLVKSKNYSGDWQEHGTLLTEPTKEIDDLERAHLLKYKEPLKRQMSIGSWGVIKNFVLQGIGVGFVPDYLIQKELKSGHLQIVEKRNFAIPYEVILITPKDSYLPKRVEVVMSAFKL